MKSPQSAWYQFGLVVGINQETLNEFANFPPEECIVEISDLWLKTCETAITWRDVADALKEIRCHQLAEKILTVYKTGNIIQFALLEIILLLNLDFIVEGILPVVPVEQSSMIKPNQQVAQ